MKSAALGISETRDRDEYSHAAKLEVRPMPTWSILVEATKRYESTYTRRMTTHHQSLLRIGGYLRQRV